MEFNHENLEQYFDSIKEIVNKSDFVAFDTELTGLSKSRNVFFDTPEMRYKNVKHNSMEYEITQLGICTFNFISDEQCFKYYPMNFLLKQDSSILEDSNFLINSATVEFLNLSQFNFNDVFRKGIFFISQNEFDKRMDKIEKEKQQSLNDLCSDIDIFDFTHLGDLIKKCEEFLSNNDSEEMKLDSFSGSYDRFLISYVLWKKIGCINGKWISASWDNFQGKSHIVIKKSDNTYADNLASINERFDKRKKSLEDLRRVADIVKYISDLKKPIIAHNSFLDITHLVDKFFQPLPENYAEFKILINELFPKIYDTKFIFNDEAFRELKMSDLEGIYNKTKEHFNNPAMKPLIVECDFSSENKFHTAHYDAKITGETFVNLLTELNKNNNNFWTHFIADNAKSVLKYLNKVKVVNVEFQYLNFNANSNDKKSDRKNVFQMTFPECWKKHHVTLYLSKFLEKSYRYIYENVDIKWIDSSSLSFRIPNNDASKVTVPHKNDDQTVTIVSFYEYFNVVDPDLRKVDEDGFETVKKRRRTKII